MGGGAECLLHLINHLQHHTRLPRWLEGVVKETAANSRGKGKGEAGEESETYREEGWGEGYAVLQRILSGCNLFSFCAGV